MEKFPVSKTVFLHLIPGFCLILPMLLLDHIVPTTIPRFLVFVVLGIFVLAPVETGIIWYYKKKEKKPGLIDLHEGKRRLDWKQTAIFSAVSIIWAILIFGALGSVVNTYLKETLFAWFPSALALEDMVKISQVYPKTILITAYLLGLLGVGIILPIVEELYFRGFLLPRMSETKYLTPFFGTVLFAVYHFWSPWMIPIRIIAIFPMVYFVYHKQNLYIGIVTHVLLNILGDFLLVLPLIL